VGSDPQQRSTDNIKPEITAIKNNQKEILSIFTKLNTVSFFTFKRIIVKFYLVFTVI